MNKFKNLIVLLLLFCFSCGINTKKAKNNDSVMQSSLDSLLQATIEQGLTPGVAVAVVSSKEVLYSKAFGIKEIGNSEALQTTDAFDFSSIVKTVVSTSVMQQVEQGNMNLDSSPVDYLTFLPEAFSTTSIKQMLSHSSGIQFSSQPAASDGSLKPDDLIIGNTSGTKLQYSNAAFYTLGKIIENQTGISFPDYVQKQVFAPIGMNNSSVASYEKMTNLTSPHSIVDEKLIPVKRPEVAPRKIGNGIFYSTIEDIGVWAQAHLNKGTINKKSILRTGSYQEIWQPNLKTGWDEMKAAAGLGWFIGTVNGRKTASHIGGTNGYSAALVIFPDDDRAIVITGNSNKLPREALIEAISKMIFP